MKYIRKRLNPISLFMAFLVLFISCEQYDDNIATPVESKLNGEEIFKSIFFGIGELSNRTILLSQISEIVDELNSEQKNEYLSNIEVLTKVINVNDPNFFPSFEQSIKSNNHLYVKNAIEEGTLAIKNNLQSIVPNFREILSVVKADIRDGKIEINNNDDIETYASLLKNSKYDDLLDKNIISSKGQMACALIVCAIAVAFYAAVAVHNTVAVAANVYLVLALWGPSLDKYKGGGGDDNNPPGFEGYSSTLKGEMLIDEIANIGW